jgi:hypothetical protein
LSGFELRRGYRPGDNYVGGPADDDLVAAARAHGSIPDVLIEFYRHIGEVSLPDVHNAYFFDPLRMVLDSEKNGVPVRAPGLTDQAIVVFGGEGDGTMFALDERGAPVYLLPPGEVYDCTYLGGLEDPTVVTNTFAEFLQWILSEAEEYAEW